MIRVLVELILHLSVICSMHIGHVCNAGVMRKEI